MGECLKVCEDIHNLDEKLEKIIKMMYGREKIFIQCGPKKYFLGSRFAERYNVYCNFKIRKDDVWLFGFPRSGTTLTQEMVWLIGNDLDYNKASKAVLDLRFPVFEHDVFIDSKDIIKAANMNANENVQEIAEQYTPILENLKNFQGTRFIKTHLPLSLMPQVLEAGCKVIYCARHPKDVIVSSYHLYNLFKWEISPQQDFVTYCKLFQQNLVAFTPLLEHVKEGWNLRNNKNFLFLFYEDTNKNKRETLVKIANFLNKTLTDSDFDKLEDHLAIDKFRKNKSVNNDHFIEMGLANKTKDSQFIRKGEVGGWTKYFTKELSEEIDQWMVENLEGSDLIFPQ